MQQVNIEKVLFIINSNVEDINLTLENLNDNLVEYGMDSISFIQVVVALEEEFDCEIPDSKLLLSELDTINKLLDILQSLYVQSGR